MSRKHVLECSRHDLPSLFRAIADALEGNAAADWNVPSLEACKKLRIEVKDEYDLVSLKLKFRNDHGDIEFGSQHSRVHRDTPEPSAQLPDYSNLKHELQASFKAIYRSVHTGKLPPQEAVLAFSELSSQMVRFDDLGAEYYAPYLAALNQFLKAWDTRDINAMHTAVDALNHVKTDCHQRYK